MSFGLTPTFPIVMNSLLGQTVALTGKVLGIGRSEMNATIMRAGGHASDRVDAATTLLVAEDGAGHTTTKFKAATRRGIPIISGQMFRKVLEGRVTLQAAVASQSLTGTPPAAAKPPTPPVKKIGKREIRQRDAAARQLEQLATKPPAGPYGIGF